MELNPIELGNGILLFPNVLKNPKKTYDFILDSKINDDPYFGKDIWHLWLPWGNYSKAYPFQDKSYKDSDSYGAELQKECLDIFFNILKVYKEKYFDDAFFEKYGIDKDIPTSLEELETRLKRGNNNHIMADMVIFETNLNATKDWQMDIHQDVSYWWGGGTHFFNFNIYVNDDYEGGEIIFFKHEGIEKFEYTDSVSGKKGEGWYIEDHFVYKMKAGDGLIFPVDKYHGVLPIINGGAKYYIRQFISAPSHKKNQDLMATLSKEDYEAIYKADAEIARRERITPVIFDSIDSIDLDGPDYVGRTESLVPCIIKNSLDISSKIK